VNPNLALFKGWEIKVDESSFPGVYCMIQVVRFEYVIAEPGRFDIFGCFILKPGGEDLEFLVGTEFASPSAYYSDRQGFISNALWIVGS
jgi:hypothetical protein